MVLFQINRFSGTKWPWLIVLFRENVSGGTKSESLGTYADRLSENMGCHSNLSTGQTSILKIIRKLSQQPDCYMSTSLGIGQGMMVIGQVITAGCGNRLQLMVRQTAAEMVTGGRKCIMELILGIIHLIHSENLLQTSFIEPAVVSHKRKALNLWGYPFPDTQKKAPELPSAQKLNSQNMKLADYRFAQTMVPVTLPCMSSLCKPSSEVFMYISFVSPA